MPATRVRLHVAVGDGQRRRLRPAAGAHQRASAPAAERLEKSVCRPPEHRPARSAQPLPATPPAVPRARHGRDGCASRRRPRGTRTAPPRTTPRCRTPSPSAPHRARAAIPRRLPHRTHRQSPCCEIPACASGDAPKRPRGTPPRIPRPPPSAAPRRISHATPRATARRARRPHPDAPSLAETRHRVRARVRSCPRDTPPSAGRVGPAGPAPARRPRHARRPARRPTMLSPPAARPRPLRRACRSNGVAPHAAPRGRRRPSASRAANRASVRVAPPARAPVASFISCP